MLLGYVYESGVGCGTINAIELVTAAPVDLDDNFRCKIMTPEVFAALEDDLAVRECFESSTCNTHNLAKTHWIGWATSIFELVSKTIMKQIICFMSQLSTLFESVNVH